MYNNQRIIKELTPYIPAVEIFRIYEREPGAAFLDSSLVNELGHYSVIGRCPYLKLVKDGKTFTINGKLETETTFEGWQTGRTGNRRKKEIRKWDDHGKFSP